jgi:hypothetical protein
VLFRLGMAQEYGVRRVTDGWCRWTGASWGPVARPEALGTRPASLLVSVIGISSRGESNPR